MKYIVCYSGGHSSAIAANRKDKTANILGDGTKIVTTAYGED